MATSEQYKELLTEIIKKQIVILGPDIAVLKARNIKEISVENDGAVTAIDGDPQQVLKKLIDEYVSLSGLIVKNIVGTIMSKYPEIKVSVNN
ncbi:MAG: hypothetical protein A2W71_01840 [Candidatus Nealsonbacteria bacterium RIFCSPLOWO2_02_39_8]|uniref:Uncharacterized protein n=3 Tax=Parcubacteria group TaxID=1794811 RepID=A0A1G2EGC9_9BACT|nr:MAG: hypothetical protein UV72_C0004G0027 [Candidatus Giovannonibacteria bacterium GW2011_GWB1_43_13]KKS99338.1 MAG: hypothetical protein UV75_C0006G0027 [Candidatus Giovannonibacteria bacterium GW2011_GWA1_43_15]KKT21718.1 MAG: hypothetical protein UW05_C0004G0012 [Candidatus Giovannonibacteria bacterium GW2011_GWC2_43_8]KKT63312.1 MAG: hypothetical protein UW55_C0005G0027 [Candidatus Giovannonibacteria bacterium GW2011_GWA2_44_26]OGF59238.1 MAG: hypothetical protein A2652_00860 [Candidatus